MITSFSWEVQMARHQYARHTPHITLQFHPQQNHYFLQPRKIKAHEHRFKQNKHLSKQKSEPKA
jgi:hypothetical protein